MRNCGDFSIFLRAFVNELWLTKKKQEEEEEEGQNGDLYSGITRLQERLDKLQG